MKKEITLYSQDEIDRLVNLSIIQHNLFLVEDLTKNLFPNTTLFYYSNFQVLRINSNELTTIVIDEILQICSSLIPPVTSVCGDGEKILYTHCSFNNYKFTNLNEKNLIKLRRLLTEFNSFTVEIYFYPFEDYKNMFNHVLRYMEQDNEDSDKFDMFFSESL